METVNRFVSEWEKNGNLLVAFLQAFHRYPTMVHEVMLAVFIISFNGLRSIDFDEVVLFAAWFATLWTLVGALTIYWVLRMFSPRWLALIVLPLCMLSGYILLYANFPRQNMPSHVLGWIALAIYVDVRARIQRLPTRHAVGSGLIWGLSVPTHYSSSYLAFAFFASELVLAILQRSDLRNIIGNLFRIFSASAVVWLSIDLYFYTIVWLYPEEVIFNGSSPSGFMSGMLFQSSRIWTEAAAHKLEDVVWWFFPGLLFRNFGLFGGVLFFVGIACLSVKMIKQGSRLAHCSLGQQTVIVCTVIAVSVVVSLGYLQNARKLMCFFPAWCVAVLYGVGNVTLFVSSLVRRLRNPVSPVDQATSLGDNDCAPLFLRPGFSILSLLGLLLAGHAASFWSTGEDIYHFRRDAGYMREYLAAHGITELLVFTKRPESVMKFVETQAVLDSVSREEASQYEWVMIYRLYRGESAEIAEMMDKLRDVAPVVSFKNQNALPIHWYEFPLKRTFADFDDPLTNSRRLYHWADVRGAFDH